MGVSLGHTRTVTRPMKIDQATQQRGFYAPRPGQTGSHKLDAKVLQNQQGKDLPEAEDVRRLAEEKLDIQLNQLLDD